MGTSKNEGECSNTQESSSLNTNSISIRKIGLYEKKLCKNWHAGPLFKIISISPGGVLWGFIGLKTSQIHMTAALRLVDYETFKKAKSFSPSDWFLIYKKL